MTVQMFSTPNKVFFCNFTICFYNIVIVLLFIKSWIFPLTNSKKIDRNPNNRLEKVSNYTPVHKNFIYEIYIFMCMYVYIRRYVYYVFAFIFTCSLIYLYVLSKFYEVWILWIQRSLLETWSWLKLINSPVKLCIIACI